MTTRVIKPTNFIIGQGATFGVSTNVIRPYAYHWKRNGALVGGSNWASYTSHPLSMEELGDAISVVVLGQDGAEESDAVSLAESKTPTTVSNAIPPVAPWEHDIEAAIKKGKQ